MRPGSAPVAALAIGHHHAHHALAAVLISFSPLTLALTRLLAHLGHRLAHLLVALLQRGDRLLLRLASRLILPLVQLRRSESRIA